jgi:hypothetical protein
VEAQKEREKTNSTTTTQSVWQKKGGLSLFGSVVQKETREDGVVCIEVGEWRVNHPASIKWTENRNKHEYERCWQLLDKQTSEKAATVMARRMAELAMWNVYGWKPTKEAFGISETKDIGVSGPKMEEMLEKAKKVKKKEEKEREKKKKVKSRDRGGSWGQGGSWNGGENWRPSFRGQCYSCRMQGHSARYCRQAGRK